MNQIIGNNGILWWHFGSSHWMAAHWNDCRDLGIYHAIWVRFWEIHNFVDVMNIVIVDEKVLWVSILGFEYYFRLP